MVPDDEENGRRRAAAKMNVKGIMFKDVADCGAAVLCEQAERHSKPIGESRTREVMC